MFSQKDGPIKWAATDRVGLHGMIISSRELSPCEEGIVLENAILEGETYWMEEFSSVFIRKFSSVSFLYPTMYEIWNHWDKDIVLSNSDEKQGILSCLICKQKIGNHTHTYLDVVSK